MSETWTRGIWAFRMPEDHITWRSANDPAFRLYGLCEDRLHPADGSKPVYERLPADVAARCSRDTAALAYNTPGVRLRFCTDSEYIAIRCRWSDPENRTGAPVAGDSQFANGAPHMTDLAFGGFDLFLTENGKCCFHKAFVPPRIVPGLNGYESVRHFGSRKMRDVTIHFPLFCNVDELLIGLEDDAAIEQAPGYRLPAPVVYYGSSITHGGCASKPGNTYEGFVSRALDLDQRNLGFSDSCRGDLAMAEYIASLDMSAFVMDYDHNAPNAEWLKKTYEPFLRTVRKAKPDLPIICVSMPLPQPEDVYVPGMRMVVDVTAPAEEVEAELTERRAHIRDVVAKLQAEGDRNIYFIDGLTIYEGYASEDCTVDGAHPTDLGFYRFAQAVIPVLKKALNL